MAAERWERLQELFHLAEDAESNEREQILTRHCGNVDLWQRALSMLGALVSDGARGALAKEPFQGVK